MIYIVKFVSQFVVPSANLNILSLSLLRNNIINDVNKTSRNKVHKLIKHHISEHFGDRLKSTFTGGVPTDQIVNVKCI